MGETQSIYELRNYLADCPKTCFHTCYSLYTPSGRKLVDIEPAAQLL